jgi:hypothetical protein
VKLEDFLPPSDRGRRVLLPHQRELIESQERYVAFVGGYGSGKTLAASILCVLLSLSVPGNVGVVIRRSYSKLHDSTLRMLLEVLERSDIGEVRYANSFQGFPHRIIFPNDAEIWVKESKDIGRWLGPEFGFAWVDEASEEPLKTFEGLVSRLRLPHAKRYLKLILTTNPPFQTHWIPKMFGTDPGVIERGGAKYRLIRSSSRDNPNLPKDYVANLIATHGEANAHRIVDGEFGFTPEGLPVFGDSFSHGKHVGEPRMLDGIPLDRAWDWGFRVPVCTWHQVYRCKAGTVHWNILHELVGEKIESEAFADKVLAETRLVFPLAQPAMVQDIGDHAGAQHNERGPGPMIRLSRPPYNLRFRYRKVVNIDPILDLIRKQLRAPLCLCGWAHVLINRSCRNVIDALAGGYHYPEKQDGTAALKPHKDGYFDNVADSVRYEAMNRVQYELRGGSVMEALRDPSPTQDGFASSLGLSGDPWLNEIVTGPIEFADGVVPVDRGTGRTGAGDLHKSLGDWWKD